jgi:hypothetical protein
MSAGSRKKTQEETVREIHLELQKLKDERRQFTNRVEMLMALVWLCMVRFRVIQLGVVWYSMVLFGTLFANLR